MESLGWFRKLFDYNHWGNRKALESIETIGGSRERVLSIGGHIVVAQRVWLMRLLGSRNAPGTPWPDLSLEEVRAASLEEVRTAAEELHSHYTAYLNTLTPEKLNEDLAYRNTQGVEFRTPVRDVLTHLVMHSAYHRGQIAAAVRESGGEPAVTDYVAYVRQLQKD